MAVTSISIVCTVWVLKLHHCCPHERPVPTWLRCIVPRRLSDHAVGDHSGVRWADRRCRNEPITRPLQTVPARTSRSLTSGVNEFLRLVGKISTAEQNVDDGHSATSPAPAGCTAHGDWQNSSASVDTIAHNNAGDGGQALLSTVAGRPVMDCAVITRRMAAMEEMLGQLASLLSKKDEEDEDSQVAADWRRVAAFADKCLFWIFLVITIIYTVTTMVLVPFYLQ